MEITVRQLIETLSSMNQDAIVCTYLDDEKEHSSIEMAIELKDVFFINDKGNYVRGDIVSIY